MQISLVVVLSLFLMAASRTTASAFSKELCTYIMVLKKCPDMRAEFKQAKTDVAKAGGQVTDELKYGLEGLIVRLPVDTVPAFEKKDYVDFMEEDHPVHIA